MFKMKFSTIAMLFALVMVAGSVWAATIEVSQPIQVTENSYYERGQSIVYGGGYYWLFYGRSASVTGTYQNAIPDVNDYALYYKKATTVAELADASATSIATPLAGYLGETGAAYFGSEAWGFISVENTGGADLYGWYSSDGSSWTKTTYPIFADMSSGAAHHDEITFDGKLFVANGSSEWTTKYSSTPKTDAWSTPKQLDAAGCVNGTGHFFVGDGTLYFGLLKTGSGKENRVYKYDSATDSWTKIDEVASTGWDGTLFKVNSSYVFAQAPWVDEGDGRQYIYAWSSDAIDAGFFDRTGDPVSVTEGQYGTNKWVDMWPIGFTDQGGTSYLFFTSERNPSDPSSEIDGNIWYLEVDWTVTNDHYTYIQEAIDGASASDVINVAAGTYTEAVTIDKSLTLLGATSGVDKNNFTLPATPGDYDSNTESIIKAPAPYGGSNEQDNPNTVTITSSNVVLKGFVIEALDRDYHSGNNYNNLIELRPVGTEATMTGITIENNVIGPNMGQETPRVKGRHGIRLTAGYGHTISATITGNKIHGTYGNGNNVFIWGTAYGTGGIPPAGPGKADLSGTTIQNNDICYSARSGIELSGAQSGATIDNNRIYGNGVGHIGGNANLKYGEGIAFVRDYVDVGETDPGLEENAGFVDGVTITNNEIYDNDKNGIYFGPMNKNHTITGNNIHDNGNAARDGGSAFGSGDGIRIDLTGAFYLGWSNTQQLGSTSNIVAHCNCIYDNVGYGAQVLGTPTNGFILDAKNNYWGSDGSGADLGKPGVGSNNAVSDYVDYTPWSRKGNVTATVTDYDYDTDGDGNDDITLNFSTLPPGGGWVSISRENAVPGIPADELPDGVGSGDVVPISLSFFTDMENGSFEVTVTIDMTGIDLSGYETGNLYIAYYSTTSEEGILVPCTYYAADDPNSGDPPRIVFTLNHFTDIIIVDPDNPIHIFLDGDPTSVAAEADYDSIIYPTWDQEADDAGFDDGYYETGSAHIYVTPGVYAAHNIAAVDFKISYDNTKLAMSAPVQGGIANLFGTSGVMSYDTPTIDGNTTTYTIHTANLSPLVEGKTTDGKLYLADLPFTLASPGFGEVSLEVIYVRYWNTSESKQYGLAKTPHDASFKFYLGDVGKTSGSVPTVGDGHVEGYDLNIWTTAYWAVNGTDANFLDKCDIGPTEDTWVFTWPTDGTTPSANGGDGVIGFEDLCIFSISWGYSASDAYPKLAPNSNMPVNIWAENKDGGEYTYVQVRVDASNAQLRAGSFTIETPGFELVEVIAGELLKREEPIFIDSRQREGFVDVDLAVIGHQTEPINDDGTLFTLKLKGNGVTSVSNVILRDMGNNDVPFVLNKEEVAALPSEFALIGATPNPFNATTAINFSVPYEAKVRIEIHDLTGRTIATLVDDEFETGRHSIIWNGSDNSGGSVSSGTYIVRMSAEDFSTSSRITLIK